MESKTEWSLVELTDTLNKTAAIDKDNLVLVDGLTGAGKSTIAMKACRKGCKWFDMEKDVLYSREDVINWVSTTKPGSWGVADEVINVLFKREFAAKQQKFLIKVLDMCRERNLTLFMCIPNFWAIDKHVLDGRVRLRIHIARTGLAFMWKPSNSPFTQDRWYRYYNEKVCWKWDQYPNARKTKGFLGFLRFGDLEVKEKEKYLKIKQRKKEEVKKREEEEETKDEISKQRSVEFGKTLMLFILKKKGLLRIGALTILAELEGVTKAALSIRLKNFDKNYGESSENLVKSVKEGTLYNNMDNKDIIDANKDKMQHSAI
ncbi:MAG TPA: hypothetical protein ENG87_03945 [Candidatus Pacearchaeota archaeon]|nr:hypothetical protein [Candidatus Pacearchaeota archaeon]HDZ61184.1 hypothetical protein [Candidatus Pacearchaeota archaeon]